MKPTYIVLDTNGKERCRNPYKSWAMTVSDSLPGSFIIVAYR